jgi:hypothetical protein
MERRSATKGDQMITTSTLLAELFTKKIIGKKKPKKINVDKSVKKGAKKSKR